jgi:hypothetical protein
MADVQNVTADMGGWMGGKAGKDEVAQAPNPKRPPAQVEECTKQCESLRKGMM